MQPVVFTPLQAHPPPRPPPPALPEGCANLLAGSWETLEDPAFRYQAFDDGGTLLLNVTKVLDAGFTPRRFRADAGQTPTAAPLQLARVELIRVPPQFEGHSMAPINRAEGRVCEARFETRVVNCADGGLLLESRPSTALGAQCQSPARPQPVAFQQHQLWRVADAGS